MALNYSQQLMFPPHISQDNLSLHGYFANGIPGNHDEHFSWPRRVNVEYGDWFDYSNERVERYASPDLDHVNVEHGDWFDYSNAFDYNNERVERYASPNSDDIKDLLPVDPFGMYIDRTLTTINLLFGDLEVDYGGYIRNHVDYSEEEYDLCVDVGYTEDEDDLCTGLDFMWNHALRFQSSHVQVDDERNRANFINEYVGERDMRDAMTRYDLGLACNTGGVVGFDRGGLVGKMKEDAEDATSCSHEALYFAFGYLGVKDLLNVERVSRSLRFTVKNDPLLWRSIHIEKPLNEISDDILLQLTTRAQGNLQCLSLLECIRITDDGLRRVVEANPRLTKLSVPACIRLSADGIVNILRSFNCKGDRAGIKHLRIGGIYGVTQEHVEELKYLLGAESQTHQNTYKPHFFNQKNLYRFNDDNQAIDVQVCPRCENVSLVYDCPAEDCKVEDQGTEECRACSVCIPRCAQCGICFNYTRFDENFTLDWVCSDCNNK